MDIPRSPSSVLTTPAVTERSHFIANGGGGGASRLGRANCVELIIELDLWGASEAHTDAAAMVRATPVSV